MHAIRFVILSQYALQSQIHFHGYDPAEVIIEATPREVHVFLYHLYIKDSLSTGIHCEGLLLF